MRFSADTKLCDGKRLAELICQWKPDRPEITPRWVNPPEWLVRIKNLPKIKSTRMAEGQPQWEFSDETKRDWSMILVAFLHAMDKGIEKVNQAREMGKKNLHEQMKVLNFWCRCLYYFVTWKAEIVKDLLTKTNVVDSITAKFMPKNTGNSRCLVNASNQSLLYDRWIHSHGRIWSVNRLFT